MIDRGDLPLLVHRRRSGHDRALLQRAHAEGLPGRLLLMMGRRRLLLVVQLLGYGLAVPGWRHLAVRQLVLLLSPRPRELQPVLRAYPRYGFAQLRGWQRFCCFLRDERVLRCWVGDIPCRKCILCAFLGIRRKNVFYSNCGIDTNFHDNYYNLYCNIL